MQEEVEGKNIAKNRGTEKDPGYQIYEIFDYLPLNIYTKDFEGRILFMNKFALKTIKKELEDVVGTKYEDIFPEALATKLNQIDAETIQSKTDQTAQIEIMAGEKKIYMYTGRKLIKTKNNGELLLAFSIDISKTVNIQEDIEKQRVFMEKVLDTDPNYIYVKNTEGNFILVNDAVANLFNTTKEDIIKGGKDLIENHAVDVELNAETDRQVIETGATVETEEKLILPDGEIRWIQTTKKPLADKDDKVNVLGISVDITEIKRHAEELVKAKKTKEQFMANMSHEIRTPINGIVGMIKLLEATPTLPDQRKYIEAIKKSSETLQVLINDILDLSVIETGNIKLEYIGFKPRLLLNTLIESFRYMAQEKGLQLTLNYDPFIADVLIGDPTRLNQILTNLIGNALKFTKKGYVRIYVLKLNEDNTRNNLQFIIEDSGIGIEEQHFTKIFESFEQGNENIARKYGGTGLGLSIVKQLIDLQKGTISLKSNEGQGTTFTLGLSFEVGNDDDIDRKKTLSTEKPLDKDLEEIDLSSYRILLVEDNEVNLLYSKMVLEKWRGNIDTALNGLEALDCLKKTDYDLILMDVLMPTMNGFEATQFIRTNFKPPKSETKIIAITANALSGDSEKCIEAGMDDYLSKPFKPNELKTAIIRQLGLAKETFDEQKGTTIEEGNKHTDLSYLMEISDNDPSFISEMIQSFIEQSPKDLEILNESLTSKDWEKVAATAHKIKPSIAFMGIDSIRKNLENIQKHAKSGNVEDIPSLVHKLEHIIHKAIRELMTELKQFKKI